MTILERISWASEIRDKEFIGVLTSIITSTIVLLVNLVLLSENGPKIYLAQSDPDQVPSE